tara:strand:+ start:134 stop:1867 length:1734 start_codon:yes stop_codon:yes gene_type:complete
MNNTTLQVKIKQRMNKIDSQDYDNIKSWELAEAFNKAQLEWCRRQLAGTNIRKEGDEMSKRRIDDLSILLTRKKLSGVDIPYGNSYGYFQSSNFGSIYDPQQGGDYLEFKRIECAAQQCFPYTPQQTEIVDVENVNTVPGYWQTNIETVINVVGGEEREVRIPVSNVPIFTFNTLGHLHPGITFPDNPPGINNQVTNWGSPFGAVNPGVNPFQGTPFVEPQQITTNEPWLYNNNLFPEFWYTDGPGGGPDFYNENLIMPFTEGNTTGDYIMSCNFCGNTGSQIFANTTMLGTMCSQANSAGVGYLVGGPNNEYINCGDGVNIPATYQPIPDLVAQAGANGGILNEQYPYTNQPNNWLNDINEVFNVPTDALCSQTGCWFIPSNVELQNFSITNWETTPESWEVDVIETQEYIDPVTNTYITQEEVTTVPFEQCYCAPGADKDRFCIKPRTMTVYQSEVANVDVILRDSLKRPDFEWSETFCTLESNHENNNNPAIRIWRKDFFIMDPVLVYYRVPRRVEIVGSVDPYAGTAVVADVECEFKDDIVELLIDYTASILAGDISDANQMIRGEQQGEKNN